MGGKHRVTRRNAARAGAVGGLVVVGFAGQTYGLGLLQTPGSDSAWAFDWWSPPTAAADTAPSPFAAAAGLAGAAAQAMNPPLQLFNAGLAVADAVSVPGGAAPTAAVVDALSKAAAAARVVPPAAEPRTVPLPVQSPTGPPAPPGGPVDVDPPSPPPPAGAGPAVVEEVVEPVVPPVAVPPPVAPVVDGAAAVVPPVVETAAPVVAPVVDTVAEVVTEPPPVVAPVVEDVVEDVAPAAAPVVDAVTQPPAETVAEAVTEVLPVVGAVVEQVPEDNQDEDDQPRHARPDDDEAVPASSDYEPRGALDDDVTEVVAEPAGQASETVTAAASGDDGEP